jgi:hypothetical protein
MRVWSEDARASTHLDMRGQCLGSAQTLLSLDRNVACAYLARHSTCPSNSLLVEITSKSERRTTGGKEDQVLLDERNHNPRLDQRVAPLGSRVRLIVT